MRLVIFDCDGVLFHSDRANVAFYAEVFRRAGVPPLPPDEEIAAHAMASSDLFHRRFGQDDALLQHVRTTAKATPYEPFFALMTPRAGLTETLTTLRESGRRLAMATNRSSTLDELIRHFELGPYFDHAAGARDGIRPKPHPDMLLHCCEVLGVDPAEAIFVGDQPSDLESANRAGVRFVGIGPVASEVPLRIDELADLPRLLEGLPGRAIGS